MFTFHSDMIGSHFDNAHPNPLYLLNLKNATQLTTFVICRLLFNINQHARTVVSIVLSRVKLETYHHVHSGEHSLRSSLTENDSTFNNKAVINSLVSLLRE